MDATELLRKLILELNEHHTINDLHPHVLSAVFAGNRFLDAAQPRKDICPDCGELLSLHQPGKGCL